MRNDQRLRPDSRLEAEDDEFSGVGWMYVLSVLKTLHETGEPLAAAS